MFFVKAGFKIYPLIYIQFKFKHFRHKFNKIHEKRKHIIPCTSAHKKCGQHIGQSILREACPLAFVQTPLAENTIDWFCRVDKCIYSAGLSEVKCPISTQQLVKNDSRA